MLWITCLASPAIRRLVRAIGAELQEAAAESAQSLRPARRFKELSYRTRRSWSRARRVVAKAEQTGDKANPRFIVTSLSIHDWPMRELYEDLYCARGEMENRIKEAQLDLFADRLSTETLPRQSAAPVARLGRLRADACAAPCRTGRYQPGSCLCAHDPTARAENRRGGNGERAAREAGDESGLSQPARVHRRLPCPHRRGALSRTHEPDFHLLNRRTALAQSDGELSVKNAQIDPARRLRPDRRLRPVQAAKSARSMRNPG